MASPDPSSIQKLGTAENNPLLQLGFDLPFGKLRPEHIEPAVAALLAQSSANLEAIESASGPATYQNTFEPLDRATELLEIAMTVVGHWECVDTSQELRDAYNQVQPEVSAFYSGIPLRPALWRRIGEAAAAAAGDVSLSPTQRRFVERTVEDYRRAGADLGDAEKARLQAISRELSTLTSRFGQNVVAATGAYELIVEDESRLEGLPPSAREAARHGAEAHGKPGYRFTLQAPSFLALVTYAKDAELRRQIYEAFESRAATGQYANPPLITEILRLRAEQAKLLGFADFADLVLEDRMAKTGAEARKFVDDLAKRSRPAFEREARELLDFRRSLEGPEAPELERWDVAYYAEKQRESLYAFDTEQLRPYFPLPRVVEGLFETARRLYGVCVEPNTTLSKWHEDVVAYDLRDADGTHLASFYADWYPRPAKRDGAWMNSLIAAAVAPATAPRQGLGGGRQLGLICANVTPPVGKKPALLTHREVETLFHEFGHLLHHCLSKVEVRHFVGANVAWDFVELPSQIMENWCWEEEALSLFAAHYETGEPLPSALLEKMKRARTFREGTATIRQLGFATLDLALHTQFDPDTDDVLAFAVQVSAPFVPAPLPPSHASVASFNHLFSSPVGYAAGYYSYKWAEVLDADAFTRFKKEGVYSRAVGEAFRRCILERGNSADPMELYESFMGRQPSMDALLERSGLKQAS